MVNTNFIIDFDSTFVQVEALDELATIALKDAIDKDEIVSQIKGITELGMDGLITFSDSLSRRLALFSISKEHIQQLILLLQSRISTSFTRNEAFFKTHSEHIYIISGGFKEYIAPIVMKFGIPESHILANEFIFDTNGFVTGYDTKSFLSQANGKVLQVQALNLVGDVVVIGDGYTDYQIRESGNATTFFAFTENISRQAVINKSDYVASRLEDIIIHVG
ncbi:MAG: HAD-IB family phosphatase [bacterium]|nr:HAD-IB family phosphatase [bacterium]